MAGDQPANETKPQIPHIRYRYRVPAPGATRDGNTRARWRPRVLRTAASGTWPELSFTAGGASLTASRAVTTDKPPTKYQYGSESPKDAKLKNRSTATTTTSESATLCRSPNRSSVLGDAFTSCRALWQARRKLQIKDNNSASPM